MTAGQPIEIVGGGMAGLSLGLALRERGVPVTLHEAGSYPRPKVCGEFITGLDDRTTRNLGLERWLAPQRHHHTATWYDRDRRLVRQRLPEPAIGVSRQWLDTQLAAAFRRAGGVLHENSRRDPDQPAEGRVFAHGRRTRPGGWLGLKLHVCGLTLDGDLEMHLGDRAYVGLSGVEDGRVNVCGLFSPRSVPPGPSETILDRHLRAAGLPALADRLGAATVCEASRAAIAGVHFGYMPPSAGPALALGDAFAAIPPFTGHGMAMALQSAAVALDPLCAWSEGHADWDSTTTRVRRALRRRFAVRLTAARLIHPWLLTPRGQSLLARLQARRLLPLRLLYHTLH
jgi:menaquinone-9 beta-reductase